MKDECWKKSTSHTTRIPYYINLETGESAIRYIKNRIKSKCQKSLTHVSLKYKL